MTMPSGEFNSDELASEISGLNDGQGGDDFSTENEAVQPETPQNAEQQSQTPQEIVDNPAWKPYLEKFDESVHGQLREVLADLDQRTQKRFDRQAQLERDYGQFAQQGINPQMLAASYQLLQNLNENPQAFYQKLGETLGMTAEEAEDLVDATQDPQTAQLQQQVAQMQQFLEKQQQIQEQERFQGMVRQEEENLSRDIEKVQSQYNLSPVEVRGVLERTYLLMQQNSAATVYDGLQSLLNERAAWEQSRPTNNAPRVLSGNGAASATPQTPFHEKDEKEQKAELVQLIEGLRNN